MTQEQIKHLEFIQAVITRMNTNSFQIKGWRITIIAALLALYAGKDKNTAFIFVAISPTILFWFLDAYYLQKERKFRKVYTAALKNEIETLLQCLLTTIMSVFAKHCGLKRLLGCMEVQLLCC